jgi:hypothetical protein
MGATFASFRSTFCGVKMGTFTASSGFARGNSAVTTNPKLPVR